jgi:hypothetical protein
LGEKIFFPFEIHWNFKLPWHVFGAAKSKISRISTAQSMTRCRSCQHVDSIFTSGDAETVEFRKKIPKIITGLTLRTPQRPNGKTFYIRRSNNISRGQTALLNALNYAFLRSSLTEIHCSKISENSENRHRAHFAEPQAAKGLEILYTSKRSSK